MTSIRIPAAADFHVHLRDGTMMETVVPTIRQGGASLAYVMVNPLSTHGRLFEYELWAQAKSLSSLQYNQ